MNTIKENTANRQRGFTLVELLISILLTSFIMGAVYGVYRVQVHNLGVQEDRLDAQEYARTVLDIMVREIRNAGYAPTGAPCAGIVTATAQTLRFQLDSNADGNCNLPNEDITYAFSTAGCTSNGNITRTDTNSSPDAQPLTNCNISTAAGNFSFVYYPQQVGATAPPPYCYATAEDLIANGLTCSGIVTVNLANIQRVSISLTVQAQNPDPNFGGQLSASANSNADLRNRGLPL